MFKKLASCFLLLLFFSLPVNAAEKRILVYGDSLSAGFGIAVNQSWPALLGQRLQANGSRFTVANASISGETTAGGRTRFAATLEQFKPTIVILALGANDGLRGLPLATLRDNLQAMIAASRAAGARVLLVGMRIPPNFGRDYTERFHDTFAQLAREKNTAYVPFLLEGFAADMALFQADRIHPNERAQVRILENVWPSLRPLLG
jgi:acyl-CoA thioesterase-1